MTKINYFLTMKTLSKYWNSNVNKKTIKINNKKCLKFKKVGMGLAIYNKRKGIFAVTIPCIVVGRIKNVKFAKQNKNVDKETA